MKMNSIVVFVAVCIGVASAGGYHTGGYTTQLVQPRQQQLVDVPYTVEYRSGRDSGSTATSYQYNYRYHQPRPQIQVQRAQLVQQATYAQPQQQLVQVQQVPVAVQTVQPRANIGAVLVPNQVQHAQIQTIPIQRSVGLGQAGIQILGGSSPYVVDAGAGLGGSFGTFGGNIGQPILINH